MIVSAMVMSMGELSITVLGSGTSAGVPMIGCRCAVCTSTDPRDRRTRPSIAVAYDRRRILVDTTPELRLQAVTHKLERIDAVVYTHAHADHIFGLDDVRRFNTILGGPLPLYANQETLETLLRAFPYAFSPVLQVDDALYRPELSPQVIEGPFDLFGRTWTPIPLPHGRFRTLGFRIGEFAYCTDCSGIPAEAEALLQNLEVLILDGLRPRPHPTHLSFAQARAVVERLRPRRAFLTHLAHDLKHVEIEASLPPEIRVAYDGLVIDC